MSIATIGIIGVGNMGMAIARALRDGGFAVCARDIRAEAEAAAAQIGAAVAGDACQLAEMSDFILVAVVDADQIEDALFREPRPASAGWKPGTPVLLCSTIAPDDAERLGARIAQAQGVPIDAPMSGGPARAAAGELSFMLAGDEGALERALPVLSALSRQRFRISTRPGDGARMKLINNLLAGINLAAGAQALAAGEAMGLDLTQMLDVIQASSGQSWIVEDRMRRVAGGDLEPRAHASILTKDLTLAMSMLQGAGRISSLGAAALARFQAALEAGSGDLDDSVLLSLERDA
ncbi:MAG: NAD(P)-dependent oxidoreductase [Burkholderiales bacterium]|nr:NAD(P)-dependent oxidoreductase [Burkholderiales bacterium]